MVNHCLSHRRSAGRSKHPQRRGAMLVVIAVSLVVFLVTVAFSVDVAYMQLTRTSLRSATDASARAGGEALSRLQDIDLARQAAKDVAAANLVAGEPLVLEDSDVVFGNSSPRPDGSWAFTPDGNPINSLNIHARRTIGSPSGSVPTFFAHFFGFSDFQPTQSATVVRMDRDICLVVDRSSSMKLGLRSTDPTMSSSDPRFCNPPYPVDSRWAGLANAVATFNAALESTPHTEQIALVSYGSDYKSCGVSNKAADIDQALTTSPALVDTAVAKITSRVFNGGTNIAAGIDKGVIVLTDKSKARPYARKSMVLMTDGHPTDGRDPVEAAKDAAAQDIVLYTVTFGDGAGQKAMRDVAATTGGKHYHAPDAETLQEIFREIALSMLVTFTE